MVQVMAWCSLSAIPLPEAVMTKLSEWVYYDGLSEQHYCWKNLSICHFDYESFILYHISRPPLLKIPPEFHQISSFIDQRSSSQ